MTEQKKPHLPIGYWIRKADELLTKRIDEAQKANGLTRTEWQVLNLLRESSSATRDQITEILRPFANVDSLATTITSLIHRELAEEVAGEAGLIRLTEKGRSVHEIALDTQKQVRERAMGGIRDTDYLTTIHVLQRLVQNLSDEEA